MPFNRLDLETLKTNYIASAVANFPEASAILDWSSFSVIRGHALAVVVISDTIYENIEQARNDIWFDTASEDALEQHLQDRGLSRGEATKANGTVRIGSISQPTNTVTIPALFQVSTDDDTPIIFVTDNEVSIDPSTPIDGEGYYTVEVGITALDSGSNGNTVQGAVNTIITNIVGVNIVYSTTVTSGGTDEESIASMRTRLQSTNTSAPHTSGWYIQESSNFSYIKDAYVECASEGNGHVNLFLAGTSGLTAEQIQDVEDYFNDPERNECVSNVVTVGEVTEVNINIDIDIYRTSGSLVTSDVQDVLEDFFNTLTVKEDFVLNNCISYLLSNLNYIYDISFNNPSSNVIINQGEVANLNTLTVNFIDTTND